MQIKIVGTSHIAKESVEEIKKTITEFQPDIVAVELDIHRAMGLLSKQKSKLSLSDIMKIGIKGFVFAKIGQFVQQKLGKIVGVTPGSEMKTALELAKKNHLKAAFIDQPIEKTLKNFSKTLSWKERGRFVADLFKGLFFRKQQMQQFGLEGLDLQKVPTSELIEKMMGQLQERYPNVYRALVSDRNKYMIKQLIKLMRDNPGKRIMVVVGAGHKQGMEELLLKVEVV